MTRNKLKNLISENWIETTLGKIVKIGRGSSPRPIQDFIVEKDGIPWVKIADATASSSRYIEKTKEFIKKEGRSTTVLSGDLIVSNSATPGIPKFMKIEACVHDGWLVFSEYKNLDKIYLYYFFLDYRTRLEHSAFGTVFKNLTTEIVRNVPILLPPLSEQQAIAQVLSSFDDKIELLREENKTLEELGQTIFKEWFGKYSINDELPEGWRVGKLGEELVIKQGRYLEAENLSEFQTEQRKYPIYGANGIRGYIDTYTYETPKVVFGCRGLCGNPRLSEKKSSITNTCMALENEKSFLSSEFIYFLSKKIDFESVTSGSAQPQITVTNLYNLEIIIPNHKILQRFDEVIYPIFTKIRNNLEQIQSLARTRDELLPKMMNGEVRVEKFIRN